MKNVRPYPVCLIVPVAWSKAFTGIEVDDYHLKAAVVDEYFAC